MASRPLMPKATSGRRGSSRSTNGRVRHCSRPGQPGGVKMGTNAGSSIMVPPFSLQPDSSDNKRARRIVRARLQEIRSRNDLDRPPRHPEAAGGTHEDPNGLRLAGEIAAAIANPFQPGRRETFQDLAAIRDVDEGRTPELLDQLVPVLVELGILSAGRPQGP